ncbi:protein SMAX1-like [Dioscorea cayenensis subsp. rotundata]|uniref:Protein SMAX1-like n=1 Tax=Dioscorea cayennensis subsp. rotundata TaxID=55577 RepID=A0AB40ANL2_DIOCR|nr:protein SMAX1-like [Dioscorea cayenensis subsp. rotundata]
MRAGLSTIQQTLTPEASAVLTAAMAEAARRGHGQTTPLHVAATLLASPAGTLRQACLRSHPTSSHPLQCRALELCFSVALDRLPTSAAMSGGSNSGEVAVTEPPISNALMAALKRAQAHQRRGCPESQQQPLLAVKVELEQLIVSILDDPGVSRVMREASFSSPTVKAAIENSISSAASGSGAGVGAGISIPHSSSPSLGLGIAAHRPQPPRNLYMNPKLHQPSPNHPNLIVGAGVGVGKTDEAARVVDILSRGSKRNPVLVGDNSPEIVMRDVIQKMERGEIHGFADAKVISLEKRLKAVDRTEIASKIRELGDLIETQVGNRVVIDLGDLKWLVDPSPRLLPIQQQQQMVVEAGRAAVTEMAKILKRFSGDGGRVYLVGTATCATYLRCQVHHPTMENDWDLQALPIASRSSISGLLTRIPSGFPGESQPAVKGFPSFLGDGLLKQLPPTTTATTTTTASSLCSLCMESYERELAKLVAKEFEKASSDSKPPLPQWLQAASNQLPVKEKEFNWKQSTEELLKKWRDTCARLHSTLPARQAFHPKSLPVSAQTIPPLKPRLVLTPSERPLASPSGSPVKTDLVLGRLKPVVETPPKQPDLFRNAHSDIDRFKRLYTGLIEKVGWQPEAVSLVIDAVLQSKSGCQRLRPGTKSDTWLMFAGPDRVGKAKMALGLSELLFGTAPVIVNFGQSHEEDGESDMNLRGRRSVNRIVDAIRQNPFSMIVLEDVDRADVVVRGTIKRAIEQGRFANSYGREVSLGNVIFVLTADWLPDDLKCAQSSLVQHEEKILEAAISGWQLELSLGEKSVKRKADWLHDDYDRPMKPSRKEPSLCLDLNLAAGVEDDHTDVSRNSSDLTVEHDHDNTRLKVQHLESSAPELIDSMDSTIIFKPVDFSPLRRKVSDAITTKFTTIIGNSLAISVDDDVLDRMVGGVWLGGSTTKLDQWTERVLVPRIEHLKSNLKTGLGNKSPVIIGEER